MASLAEGGRTDSPSAAAQPGPGPGGAGVAGGAPQQRRPRVLLGLSGGCGGARRAAQPLVLQPQAACCRASHRRNQLPHPTRTPAGSVATIKAPLLASCLCAWADVKVVATSAARYFVTDEQLLAAARPLLGDDDEWRQWKQVRAGDCVRCAAVFAAFNGRQAARCA